jgi:hypothetical protein
VLHLFDDSGVSFALDVERKGFFHEEPAGGANENGR